MVVEENMPAMQAVTNFTTNCPTHWVSQQHKGKEAGFLIFKERDQVVQFRMAWLLDLPLIYQKYFTTKSAYQPTFHECARVHV